MYMLVVIVHSITADIDTLKVLLQEQERTLVKDLEAFFLIMLRVLVLRPDSLTVLIMALVSITVSTLKMLE